MYGGYAWLTNAVRTDRASRRLLLLGGMAGFLVVALAIPTAYDGDGLIFGLGYLVVIGVHATLFLRASAAPVAEAFRGIVPFNLAIAALVLAGGALGDSVEYACLAAAFALAWLVPKWGGDSGFEIGPAHFVERHGLVVIVAIGESVIAVGIGASELSLELGVIAVAILGLGLSACLWWAYFGADDARAERALLAAPRERRPDLALAAYGYWHIPILLGILVSASALEVGIAHASDPLALARALALAGGISLFMLGEALFRRTLRIGRVGSRLAAAMLALATIPIGTELSAVAQLLALVAALAATLALDRPGEPDVAAA
jgi:low temperature requirement protein LtrA